MEEISKRLEDIENEQQAITRDVSSVRMAQDQVDTGMTEIENLKRMIYQLSTEVNQLNMNVMMMMQGNQLTPTPVFSAPQPAAMPGMQPAQYHTNVVVTQQQQQAPQADF